MTLAEGRCVDLIFENYQIMYHYIFVTSCSVISFLLLQQNLL